VPPDELPEVVRTQLIHGSDHPLDRPVPPPYPKQRFNLVIREPTPHLSRRRTHYHRVRADVAGHYCASTDHGTIADGDAGHDRRTQADPHIVSNVHIAPSRRVPILVCPVHPEEPADGECRHPVGPVIAAHEYQDIARDRAVGPDVHSGGFTFVDVHGGMPVAELPERHLATVDELLQALGLRERLTPQDNATQ
jgi:hypothetical protein